MLKGYCHVSEWLYTGFWIVYRIYWPLMHTTQLQVITAPPLISRIHESPQHSLSLFQPAVSSSAVPCQRLLTVEILQLHALKSSLHRLRTELTWSSNFPAYNSSAQTTQKHPVSNSTSIVARQFFAAGTCLPSSWPDTDLVYLPLWRSSHSNGSTL
jgi:hypothetical protein